MTVAELHPLIIELMHAVHQHSSTNMMDAANLSIVLCPNLIHDPKMPEEGEMPDLIGEPYVPRVPPAPMFPIVRFWIEYYPDIYDGQAG